MSDLISRSYVIDLLYKTFDEYRIATDKTSTLGGFGSEVFKRIREMPTVYDIDKVVEELEEIKDEYDHSCIDNAYQRGAKTGAKWMKKRAIEIVRHGGVSDDVCEEVCCEWKHFSGDKSPYRPSCKEYMKSKFEAFKIGDYCTFCGKKIKIVGD